MTKVGNSLGSLLNLVDNPDKSWQKFGKDDPYFGVLSAERFRKRNLDAASLSDFFASGEAHVAEVLDIVRRQVAADLAMNSMVDFGCGVGRLLLPFARRFGHATGIDVSEDYIAEAIRNCRKEGINNTDFFDSVKPLAAEGRSFDLVHSCIVFNHIPWSRGREIIGDLYGLLNPGGVMAIQVLHRHKRGSARRIVSWTRRNFAPANWAANILQRRPAFEPLMQGNAYPLDELLPYLAELGTLSIHVRPEAISAGQSFAFIFCRKPWAKDRP